MVVRRGRHGFDGVVGADSLQRVAAYRASPGVGTNASANDMIASEADRGIADIEAFLADQSALVSA